MEQRHSVPHAESRRTVEQSQHAHNFGIRKRLKYNHGSQRAPAARFPFSNTNAPAREK